MAFRRLTDCDPSDMLIWARGAPARNFIKEVEDLRDQALRGVVDKLDAVESGKYKAYVKVLELFEQCLKLK